ncbi:MAG: RecQ family ATP-dependent DNA helicase, partial [Gemmataceae bacterium]
MANEVLRETISTVWGFQSLRPLQREAMEAFLQGRDSLVVLPTGGGKSLCYQAPAVALGGTTVVVSPLIALMKDQVDSLRACGIAACQLDSSQSAAERKQNLAELREGRIRLLYVSPEKLIGTDLPRLLRQLGVRRFAIDEAHCISHWGHDFRPDYRMLGQRLPALRPAPVIALTATATPQVQEDILEQLGLPDAARFIHGFRRDNLAIELS